MTTTSDDMDINYEPRSPSCSPPPYIDLEEINKCFSRSPSADSNEPSEARFKLVSEAVTPKKRIIAASPPIKKFRKRSSTSVLKTTSKVTEATSPSSVATEARSPSSVLHTTSKVTEARSPGSVTTDARSSSSVVQVTRSVNSEARFPSSVVQVTTPVNSEASTSQVTEARFPSSVAHATTSVRSLIDKYRRPPKTTAEARLTTEARPTFEKRIFQRCPRIASQATFKKRQIFHHDNNVAALAFTEEGFTLSDGSLSYCDDNGIQGRGQLLEQMRRMRVGQLFVVDKATEEEWLRFKAVNEYSLGRIKDYRTDVEIETPCTYCHKKDCHRWMAIVAGIQPVLRRFINPIPH